MNLKALLITIKVVPATSTGIADPHLDLSQLLCGQAQSKLVASPLILEAVYASEGLGDGDVEDEVGQGEQEDWDPAVAALEAPAGLGLAQEHQAQEDEEELEQLVELLLLQIDGPLLL